MAGVHYLVDTNVLLRLVKSNDPEFPLARSATHALKARGDLLFFTSPTCSRSTTEISRATQA